MTKRIHDGFRSGGIRMKLNVANLSGYSLFFLERWDFREWNVISLRFWHASNP